MRLVEDDIDKESIQLTKGLVNNFLLGLGLRMTERRRVDVMAVTKDISLVVKNGTSPLKGHIKNVW